MAFQPVRQRKTAERAAKPSTSRRAYLSDKLCLSTDCKKKPNGDGTIRRSYSMRITIPKGLMEAAKIAPGDRVEFEIDPENRCCLIRPCSNGRWTITTNGEIDDKGYLRISLDEGMPTVVRTEACYKPKIGRDGIAFMVHDNASFDRNLRAEALTQTPLPLETA